MTDQEWEELRAGIARGDHDRQLARTLAYIRHRLQTPEYLEGLRRRGRARAAEARRNGLA